jgi:hypothetical protein
MGMAKPIVWWNHVDMAMENTPFIEFIVDFCMKSHAYKGISHFFFDDTGGYLQISTETNSLGPSSSWRVTQVIFSILRVYDYATVI